MDTNSKTNKKKTKETSRGSDHAEQGRATYKHSSTTQAGSDFGQGSSNLGPESYKQGSEKNEGSNYENERKPIPGNNTNQDVENGFENEKRYTGPNKNDPNTNT